MKIGVFVKPGSSKNLIEQDASGLRVWLRANPEEGKANTALVCLLADHYGVSRSQVRIVTGLSSRKKIVEIQGIGGPEGT